MTSATQPLAARRPRDPRLDFFRGLAMFIILASHTPGNVWALWIPARFGFSDATEIFVFSSGMASAFAFGTVFTERGFALGAARIAHRVWQVYWAHIGILLAAAAFSAAVDGFGWGLPDKRYIASPWLVPLFERTEETLIGLLTLSYVPGLFDILPMYLAILAMIPAMVAVRRWAGTAAAAGLSLGLWMAANLAGFAFDAAREGWAQQAEGLAALGVAAGGALQALNLPATPWGEGTWFFNPFAWQLVFFAGFALGAGWLRPPPRDRRLALAAAAFVILSVPFAWFKLHGGLYLPAGSIAHLAVSGGREAMEPLIWKTWQGGFRFLHFLSLAYLAWFAVGPRGEVIDRGFRPADPPPPVRLRRGTLAAAVAFATAPYAYVDAVKAASPALDAWLLAVWPALPGERIGLAQLAHLAALLVLAWSLVPLPLRRWLLGDLWRAATPVVRRVGSQSLAVFMTSIPLALLNGLLLDLMGRGAWSFALVNLWGFAVLIAVAYGVGWIKSQPWRRPAPAPVAGPRAPAQPAE